MPQRQSCSSDTFSKQQLYDLYNDIIGSPYSEISNRRHNINALLSRLEEEEGADAKFQEDVAKEIHEIDVLQRRRAFMRKVKNISRHDWGQDRLRQYELVSLIFLSFTPR